MSLAVVKGGWEYWPARDCASLTVVEDAWKVYWPARDCVSLAVVEGVPACKGLRVPGRGVVELACKGACVLGQTASQWLLQKQRVSINNV